MYISEIDDILDKTLDKFMYSWILDNKNKEIIDYVKLIRELNFVKFQKEINVLLEYGISLISDKDISKFVSKVSNINLIKNLVLKYIGYYLFLFVGINYNGKIESFNNNIIEISRTQANYKLRIDNFFNTETNSNIIKITNLTNQFIEYIEKTINNKKKDNQKDINISNELNEFIKSYGEENIDKIIELYKKEYSKNKVIIQHNIIKIMIYLNLYKASEKKEIFNIIETTETSNGEFIFIDIVIPKSSFIDYNAIESILEPYELKTSLPETIYGLINDDHSENIIEARKYFTDFDLKIQKLLDTHLIVPIVDDFLLYHKDNERYEKQLSGINDKKKKEDTKIKYIVNKINTVSDYYKNQSEIKKLFYVPLANRNGVLVNTYEDLKIISKMKNIVKIDNENIDLLSDLINYRLYPYISFKEFKVNGFFFNPNTTTDAIRNCSINDIGKEKFDILQTRILSENMSVNIIGFAVINTMDSIDCINTNTFVNISDETNNPLQAMKVLLENKIKNLNFKNIKEKTELKKNYYWLFDLKKQNYSVPYYDISPNMNPNDIVKILSAYLYDWVIECVINLIKEDINNTHPKLIIDYMNSFDKFKHKFKDIENQQYSSNINELEYLMYYVKSKKVDDIYDYREDEFPGLYGDVIKLPIVPKKKNPPIPVVKIKPDFKTLSGIISSSEQSIDIDIGVDTGDTNEHINGICQHNISWDKIGELKKQNDIRYSDLVYEFIQQYLEINPTQDFICKSCKSSINIKRYIQDGSFDNTTQTYVTFSVQVDAPLEDFPEYEKFKTSIKSLDKIIDRVSSIINFQGLFGSSYTNRSKRKNIIKDTLDIVIYHNLYLKKSSYLTNRDKFIKLYGINKNISYLYIFELENNIFIYSSKDKDYYKSVKFNNIISYILILLVLEMNDTQIQSLSNDKICSYFIYKKIGHTLFENMNIIINKSNDIKPIKDYPILCYLIYIISCFITKYNLWADVISTETNVIDRKKNFLIIQKSVINTVVEIFNSLLQVNAEELKLKKIYLYEIFQNKYYFKLNDLFKDFNLVRKLDKMYLSEGLIKQQKQVYIDSSKFDIEPDMSDAYNRYVSDNLYSKYSKKYCLKRLECPLYDRKKIVPMNVISNLTNCVGGEFHDFKAKDKNLYCVRCNEMANPNNFIPDSEKIIGERYIILYLRKLAKKYCQSGQLHQFEFNKKSNTNVCLECGYVQGSTITFSDKELFKLYDTIEQKIKNNNIKLVEIISKHNNLSNQEISSISNLFNKVVYKYEKYNNDITKSVAILLDKIHKLLGKDIIINNKTHNLYSNIYIIENDHTGTKLSTPIMILEDENKFRTIENHSHYKRDVLVYTMQKNTKYELFYDFEEKIFLGYREINKEYKDSKNFNIKLKINYSLKNMLMLIGFTRQNINIVDFYPEIIGLTKNNFESKFEDFKMEDFLNKIAMRRFDTIKKMGMELKKYINRFKNNYKVDVITFEATFFDKQNKQITNTYISDIANNPNDLLYMEYKKKIEPAIVVEHKEINESGKEINESGKENKKSDKSKKTTNDKSVDKIHIFLKYINLINIYLSFDNLKLNKNDIPNFSNKINYNLILKNDYLSNVVLNYIIDEIIRLMEYNTNKNIKTNLIHFIIDLISNLFNSTFYEISKFNQQLSYFYQILYTSEFYLETQNTDYMIDALDYYSNQEEIKNIDNLDEEQRDRLKNQIDDDNEEMEGMDMVNGDDDIEGIFDMFDEYEGYEVLKSEILI
jgi:hypothetical protein